MILSLVKSRFYMSWVFIADKKVIGQKTYSLHGLDKIGLSLKLVEAYVDALTSVSSYLITQINRVSDKTTLYVETNDNNVERWLRFGITKEEPLVDKLRVAVHKFNLIPCMIEVEFKKNPLTLWANKYNSEVFIEKSDLKTFRAVDMF